MRDRLVAADIEDAADGGGRLHQGQNRPEHVGDVGETPLLAAVAVDLGRTAGQRGVDQPRQHHAVGARPAAARPR